MLGRLSAVRQWRSSVRMPRRIGLLFGLAGLAVALILALQPMRFFTPGEVAKDEILPAQMIDCGTAFRPKNAPANTTEECDSTHVRRAFQLTVIIAGAALVGAAIAFGPTFIRRRENSAVEDLGDL